MVTALLAYVAVLVAGPLVGGARAEPWPLAWTTQAGADHPLVGRIWDTRRQRYVTPDDLVAALAAAEFRLLGEIHDNGDHHRLRAAIVARVAATLSAAGRPRQPVVFEHLRAEQREALSRFAALAADEQTSSRLFDLVDWDASGWPARALFAPLFDAVLAARLPIVLGDGARTVIRAVARQGIGALAADERARLGGVPALADGARAALLDELEASHCGLMPRAALGGMADAQGVRDAHLARQMADAAASAATGAKPPAGAFLMAGNGHVRRDRGVPWFLGRMLPGARIVVVAIAEVEAGRTAPEGYGPRDATAQPAADFIIWTPRAARGDPCEQMRKAFTRRPPRSEPPAPSSATPPPATGSPSGKAPKP